jgi:hypothetical protein
MPRPLTSARRPSTKARIACWLFGADREQCGVAATAILGALTLPTAEITEPAHPADALRLRLPMRINFTLDTMQSVLHQHGPDEQHGMAPATNNTNI